MYQASKKLFKVSNKHWVKIVPNQSFSGPYFPHSTESRDLWSKSPYSIQMWENTDQKNLKTDTFHTAKGFGITLIFWSCVNLI